MTRTTMGRRILALLLVLFMTVGVVPLAAFAEGEIQLSSFVSANSLQYNGQEQQLLTVNSVNKPADVELSYAVGSGAFASAIPSAKAIGSYTVQVKAMQGGQQVALETFYATIGGNGISMTPLCEQYNGAPRPVVAISGTQTSDAVEYSTDGGVSWQSDCPTLTDVGMLQNLAVRVKRDGTEIYAAYGITAKILQNSYLQLAYQNGYSHNGVLECTAGDTSIALGAKFAYDNHPGDLTIQYGCSAIKTVSRDNGTTAAGMTVDAATGTVTLNKSGVPTEAGLYEVYARIVEPEGKSNYTEAAKTLTQYVVVSKKPELAFSQEQLDYILGSTPDAGQVNANVPGLTVSESNESAPVIPNNGAISYSMAGTGAFPDGVTMDSATGKFTVGEAILDYIGDPTDGKIASYTVTAQKAGSTYNFGEQTATFTGQPVSVGERPVYTAADAQYTLNIIQSSLGATDVAAAYEITPAPKNGWYCGGETEITVTAKPGYKLAKQGDSSYAGTLTFSEDGDDHWLYLQNAGKGIVSGLVRLVDQQGSPVRIDATKPENFRIVYTKVTVLSIVEQVLSLGFKQGGIRAAITASDSGSGIEKILVWAPGAQEGTTLSYAGNTVPLPGTKENAFVISSPAGNKTSFSADLVITAPSNPNELATSGLIMAVAEDVAGNVKEGFDAQTVYTNRAEATGGNVNVITDPDTPQITVVSMDAFDNNGNPVVASADKPVYYQTEQESVTRFNPDTATVDFSFKILDDNLDHGDTKVLVNGESVLANVSWEDIPGGKKGTFRLSGDGEYLVSISATDKANNNTVLTRKLVLDTTQPVVQITASTFNPYQGVGYTKEDIVYTIVIDEVNFAPEKVSALCEKDGGMFQNGTLGAWSSEGSRHTATFTIRNTQQNNGRFTLKVFVNDGVTAQFPCSSVEKEFETPIVLDTVSPEVTVTYADEQNTGYYNFQPNGNGVRRTAVLKVIDANPKASIPHAEIIAQGITATDITGASVPGAVEADDSRWQTDRELELLFKAEVNYQLDLLKNGLIQDLAGNTAVLSGSYETAFTLDSTAPNAPGKTAGTIQVDINIGDANKGTATPGSWWERIVDGVKNLFGYWNSDIQVTITAEDLVSGLEKASYTFQPNLGVSRTGTVTLTQRENDKKSFSGTFKLPGNVFDTESQQLNGKITVWLNDRTGNQAVMTDQGWHIVYDTINPELQVSYATCVNEPEDGNVSYFAAPATATVRVLEENFEPDILTITNNDSELTNLSWTEAEGWNETSFGIGEEADGEYTIKVTGQDYAGNALQLADSGSVGYTSKKLIVDTTAPVLSVAGVTSGERKRSTDTVDYYMDAQGVHFGFTILETNFDQKYIQISVQKNGVSAILNTDYTLTWTKQDDLHTCDIHMTGDGEYTISIEGKDLAKNKLTAGENTVITNDRYQYEKAIVLDNTPPEISLTYALAQGVTPGGTKNGKQYISGDVQFTLTVKDNFLNAAASAEDLGGVYLHIEKTKDGDLSEKDLALTADVFDKDPVQNRGKDTVYTYQWTEQEDAEYNIEARYTDFAENKVDSKPEYIPVIDKTAPTLSIVYADGKQQQYYNMEDLKTAENADGYRMAVVTIQERNLDTDMVTDAFLLSDLFLTVEDVEGISLKTDSSVLISKQPMAGQTDHVWKLTFAQEANYSFDLVAKDDSGKTILQDLAGNELILTTDSANYEKVFTIDRTAPSAEAPTQEQPDVEPGTIRVTYNIPKDDAGNDKWYTNLWEKIRFGFWKETIEVRISCYEEVAGIDPETAFIYTFTRAETTKSGGKTLFASKTNVDTFRGKVKLTQDETDKKLLTAVVKLPKDALKSESPEGVLEANPQLNGNFSLTITDRCGNESKYSGKPENAGEVETRLVYDTISPTRDVSFGNVVNTVGNKSYFAGDITGTVRIREANFFINNGKTDIVSTGYDTSWVSTDADNHVGTFKITGEGEHSVTVTGKDYAGNKMEDWTSGELIIDTKIDAPVITVNGEDADGGAFKENVILGISFFDTNFRTINVQVLRTRLGEKNVDVTTVLERTVDMDDEGGMVSYEPLAEIKENDGIYTVTVTMEDWAGHKSTATSTFSVNRFGSVYTYGDYLLSIIQNGGAYLKAVGEDLVIREINADRLVGDVKIQITKDGKPLGKVLYTSNALQNDLEVGDSGWYEYTHVIGKENFRGDGLYKISISSQDGAGNHPENSNMEGMSIQFYVDSTPPELTSVTGLEQAIVNAEAVDVRFVAYDTIGLNSVRVYLDGQLVDEVTDFSDSNNYSGGLQLGEMTRAQTVRIVLEDLAGNVLDTGSGDFQSAYAMVDSITVSTNFWVRFLANKPLLYGCIAAVVTAAAGVGIGVPTAIAISKKGKYGSRK